MKRKSVRDDEPAKKQTSLTLRLDDDLARRFGALLSLSGMSAQDYLRGVVVRYIEENKKLFLSELEAMEKNM